MDKAVRLKAHDAREGGWARQLQVVAVNKKKGTRHILLSQKHKPVRLSLDCRTIEVPQRASEFDGASVTQALRSPPALTNPCQLQESRSPPYDYRHKVLGDRHASILLCIVKDMAEGSRATAEQ